MGISDKAAEELAKLGQKSLETADKAGGWADSVFGKGMRHLGGAFEDSMAAYRVRNRIRVLEKTRVAIEKSGMIGSTKPIDPRIAVPILDAISDESDEDLQDVWAAYIANAVNPKKLRADRILIDVIRKLEPSDWPVLQQLFALPAGKYVPESLGREPADLENALDRLTYLGLFSYDDPRTAFLVMGEHLEAAIQIKIGEASYYENKLFRKLAEATSIENLEGVQNVPQDNS